MSGWRRSPGGGRDGEYDLGRDPRRFTRL